MSEWEQRRGDWKQQADDKRTPFDVDYARLVHSGSFRRLQGKTQVLNLGDSDYYRTRLTHSLEVAQIANSMLRQLADLAEHPVRDILPTGSLIQAIAFAHDLGHPPFGHGGEVALNFCMRDHGGFEGNGQTLRILSRLENFSKNHGADLTRRTLLGVLKYPASYRAVCNPEICPVMASEPESIRIIDRKRSKPPKCYLDSEQDIVDWVLAPLSSEDRKLFTSIEAVPDKHSKAKYKSLDCSMMDVADDIAYGVHDLEDAIAMGLVKESDFRAYVPEEKCSSFLEMLKRRDPEGSHNNLYGSVLSALFGDSKDRKHYIGRLVHHFITSLRVDESQEFTEPLIRFNVKLPSKQREMLDALQELIKVAVILSAEVQHLEFKGQKMVVSVFEAIASEPAVLLPRNARTSHETGGIRAVCDYVAGMTDAFLLKTYERLFSPRMGSVFDKI